MSKINNTQVDNAQDINLVMLMHWTKFQKSSHLTPMDFSEILSSQCIHQEMEILKFYCLLITYGPFNLDIESLQLMAFWN